MSIERRIARLEERAGLDKAKMLPKVICVRWYGTEKKECPGYEDTELCIRYKESEKPNGNNCQVFFQDCDGCKGVLEIEAGA